MRLYWYVLDGGGYGSWYVAGKIRVLGGGVIIVVNKEEIRKMAKNKCPRMAWAFSQHDNK